jgi:biotin carboxyl carrier protein
MSLEPSTSKAGPGTLTDADVERVVRAFRDSGFSRLDLKLGSTALSLSRAGQGGEDSIDGRASFDAVVSPSVGYFHHAADHANAGLTVSEGTVLGVVRTLNGETEVRTGVSGVIAAKLAMEGEFVAYGQPLFQIRANAADKMPDQTGVPKAMGAPQ